MIAKIIKAPNKPTTSTEITTPPATAPSASEVKKERKLEFHLLGFKERKAFGWQQTIEIRSELGLAIAFKKDGEWHASLGGILFKAGNKNMWMLKELLLEIKRILEDADSAYAQAEKAHQERAEKSLKVAQKVQAEIRESDKTLKPVESTGQV